MTFAEDMAIAVLQGVTGLFPISSLGHAVVVPALIAPGINLRSAEFLPFLAVLHLRTATVLLLYFWRDWWELFRGIFQGGEDAQGENRRRLLVSIAAATIPAGGAPSAVIGHVPQRERYAGSLPAGATSTQPAQVNAADEKQAHERAVNHERPRRKAFQNPQEAPYCRKG